MLTALHIENIAIIDQLDMEFQKGFTVLTGETGAGKSIIIDSILLLLGGKSSKDLIRTGEMAGIVSASFCDLSDQAIRILEENDLRPDDDGNITIYRKIGMDGRNHSRINGINVTVSLLKELGEYLINIHGQHDGVLLLDNRRHLSYLDEFGELEAQKEAYYQSYIHVKSLRQKIVDAQRIEIEKEQRRAKLVEWLKRLEDCDLREGEYEELLEKRKKILTNGEIIEGLHITSESIYDGDISASQLVRDALNAAMPLEKLIPNGTDFIKRLSVIADELEDIGAEFGKLFSEYTSEQMEPEQIEERLDKIEEIKKEFGPSDQAVLEHQLQYRAELEQLDSNADTIRDLEALYSNARESLDRLAAQLTEQRKSAAKRMEEALQKELCYLDMPKVHFDIRVQDRINDRGGIRYRADGKDDVEFFLSANEGELPRPLAKIASGGELSRIMLSMKSVLNHDFDTIIYDEVDTGVSGATAEKIGKKLQKGSGQRQVFCITHLAQIASKADHHFFVSKAEKEGRVFSNVNLLDKQERIREIARIMGGEELTKNLLKSAEELIENSKINN